MAQYQCADMTMAILIKPKHPRNTLNISGFQVIVDRVLMTEPTQPFVRCCQFDNDGPMFDIGYGSYEDVPSSTCPKSGFQEHCQILLTRIEFSPFHARLQED